ncbi:MAG: hypothetical protein IPL74_08570 [Bacteroidetes bacterium]|nr:hypothetical protein [Bacteroidota bacterium]
MLLVLFLQDFKQKFVTTDIDNFWLAMTKQHLQQKKTVLNNAILKELDLDRGTEGLIGLIEVRNYTEKGFHKLDDTIPKLLEINTTEYLKVASLYPKIEANIQKLKNAYPELKLQQSIFPLVHLNLEVPFKVILY